MIKKHGIYILFGFSVLVFTIANINKIYFKKNKYSIKLLKHKAGWGYAVYKKNQLFIQQNFIPNISGNYTFANKDDALKTANLVVVKLQNHQMPSITEADLDSLHITIPR